MTEQQTQINEAQRSEWVREQFQRANKHLAENGILFDTVLTAESRYLAPYVAVWKITAQDKKKYWVLSGDLPADFTEEGNAKDARDALRYFSMMWQMKSANLRAASSAEPSASKMASLLESNAEEMFKIYSDDDLWAAQAL